jgi:hypothetical protein
MKKQIALIITMVTFIFQPLSLSAFVEDSSYKDQYSWEMSDSDQKKVATGMVMWGFFLAIASMLISGFIPNSTTPPTSVTPPT